MRTENVVIKGRDVIFHIGKKQSDNFKVIDMGKTSDVWFHAKHVPSCHVVCVLPEDEYENEYEDRDKKFLKRVLKKGIQLCKQHTNKIKGLQNVEFVYTEIKNITKTETDGCVITEKTKTLVC